MEGRPLVMPKGDLSKDFSPLAEIKISDDQVVVSPSEKAVQPCPVRD